MEMKVLYDDVIHKYGLGHHLLHSQVKGGD